MRLAGSSSRKGSNATSVAATPVLPQRKCDRCASSDRDDSRDAQFKDAARAIGRPDDVFEQEADRAAEAISAGRTLGTSFSFTSVPALQKKPREGCTKAGTSGSIKTGPLNRWEYVVYDDHVRLGNRVFDKNTHQVIGSWPWMTNNPGDITVDRKASRAKPSAQTQAYDWGAIPGVAAETGVVPLAVFPDMGTGLDALVKLLSTPEYVNLTLEKAIDRHLGGDTKRLAGIDNPQTALDRIVLKLSKLGITATGQTRLSELKGKSQLGEAAQAFGFAEGVENPGLTYRCDGRDKTDDAKITQTVRNLQVFKSVPDQAPPEVKALLCCDEAGAQKKAAPDRNSNDVPSSIVPALRGSGEAMDPATRTFMEGRFGFDFSAVRIHADASAAASARDQRARAYTVGHDIVFANGQYAPRTRGGRELLAHELTHVLQQRRMSGLGVQRDLAIPDGVRQPTIAKLTAAQLKDAIDFNAGQFRVARTLAIIREVVNDGPGALKTDEALAQAIGRWQARHGLNQDGRLEPATLKSIADETKAEQADLIAWQKGAPAAASTPPDPKAGATSLDALPTAVKQRIQVVTASVKLDQKVIDSTFAKPAAGAPRAVFMSGLNEVHGAGIPDNAKNGLSQMAGYLHGFDAIKPDGSKTKALDTNTTITLEISLRPHLNLAGLFRFTRIADTANPPGADSLIIELVRELPPMNSSVLNLEPGLSGAFTVGGASFVALTGWRQDSSAILRKALETLPPGALQEASGLKFEQTHAGKKPDEAGEYDPESDTVSIFDNAFTEGNHRSGESPSAVATVAHEVGHALDLRPHTAAFNAANAKQTPAGWDALPRFKTQSGARWVKDPPPAKNSFAPAGEKNPQIDTDFRKAAASDGFKVDRSGAISGAVTEYGNTDWQEAFAESFTFYVTDPGLLNSLRPNTFAYFAKRYPRPKASP